MKVFVYGTLMRGEPNHNLLEGAEYLGEAETLDPFALVNVGWFPGLLKFPHLRVKGEAYKIDDAMLVDLDNLEGEGSLYIREEIETSKGTCYAYIYNRYSGEPEIMSGDWRTR